MQNISDKLIVALDMNTLKEAEDIVKKLYPVVKLFKIGSQLFTACGLEAVKMVGKKGARVFLDLKFYDIPQTVFSAVSSGTGAACEVVFVSTTSPNTEENIKGVIQSPVFMMTVHTSGGREMLEKAAEGARIRAKELKIDKPLIIGVTVLTSEPAKEQTLENVLDKAKLAQQTGLDGVVCSVHEAAAVRKACGKDFIIVTPGIRLKGAENNDQKRMATPQEAIKAGANYIVVGRPILQAQDPLKAVQEILQEKSGD